MATTRSADESAFGSVATLIKRLCNDLRRIAAAQLRAERGNHTPQPTALVHEAYARLARQPGIGVNDRVHVLAIASQVTLNEGVSVEKARSFDVLILDGLLQRWTNLNSLHGRVVELHFFGGLSFEGIAEVPGIGLRTVKRDWAMGRAWLSSELSR
jgi:RNA polymerase sigma-70 factor, ECF subfamily